MDLEKLSAYKELLPSRITVVTEKSERGLYAKIEELPHCYTQADNFVELIDMVNDAVFSYLDIPEEYRGALGYYAPAKFIEEIQHQRWQEAITQMLNGSNSSIPSIFNRIDTVTA